MKKIVLIILSVVLVTLLAGCLSNEQKADKAVYYTLWSVLTLKDPARPLSTRIVKITYEHTNQNEPGAKKPYYMIKGYVTVRRTALKDFNFRGQVVPKGSSHDYQYYYEAKVVTGIHNTLVIVSSGLMIKKLDD